MTGIPLLRTERSGGKSVYFPNRERFVDIPISSPIQRYHKENGPGYVEQLLALPTRGLVDKDNLPDDVKVRLPQIMDDVSKMIYGYATNVSTANEMLPKSPRQLYEAFLEGNSSLYIVFDPNERKYLPVAHAATWELLPKEVEKKQHIQAYEFGSWIVHPDFRHKFQQIGDMQMSIGEIVAQHQLDNIHNRNKNGGSENHIHYEMMATVKRENSQNGLKKVGFQDESFHSNKWNTGLTCSCKHTSEYHQCGTCQHRRTVLDGGEELQLVPGGAKFVPKSMYVKDGHAESKRIPCTLMTQTNNIDRYIFHKTLSSLLEEYKPTIFESVRNVVGGDSLEPTLNEITDTTTVIEPRHMAILKSFYQLLGVQF